MTNLAFEQNKQYLLAKETYDMSDFLLLLRLLRDPENGCPWDSVQTHQTVRNNFIEETYEVIEAIDTDNAPLLREELGDVLLQVAFHAGIEEDAGRFDFNDVVDALCKKLIYRHPHVFGDEVVTDAEHVLVTWNRQKNAEKTERVTVTDKMNAVPRMLPALIRAYKVGKRAPFFDFEDADGVLAKLREETDEVGAAIQSGDSADMEEELGDLLLTVTSLARKLHINPEEALYRATDKFINRFALIEEAVQATGKNPEQLSMQELDAIWDENKKKEKEKQEKQEKQNDKEN